ncbi:tripartite tricarboxylate transporter substrate binding protein [Siccirubricoccus sp. KC 17139]|uniref:Tripartite tricarboxylate transporter substrate binding protein n=1 Tax=Siccirubricoccus soli TaxID=2899147 RepID=A0ABT1CZZ8_9PROT|nr:tripartite tricarboxylate transporter substrate binding protein [Siccirubricoccus soli]MCO6415222.1 tripartite tricarboxylate transporter substrate binding protein [Siccirubricoccus soli]MCP2681353.1 tripartite tricarboxylate transporter substrate binding protein [Siccirubricoccus soli]
MDRRHLLFAAALGTLALHGRGAVLAQGTFPDRPIRLVLGFAAGGPTDIVARRLADRLGSVVRQSIVVENRTGASGTIASAEVARARPDGYTLMLATSSSHAIAATLMRRPTFDPIADFAPIALVGEVPMVMAVHPSFEAQSLPALLELVRRAPRGSINYASSGAGGIAHFTAELLMRQAGGVLMTQVPYRGAGLALQDLLAGHVPIYIDTFATTLNHHREGRLRIIANFSRIRSPAAPEVPTAIELGVPDMVANTYNALLAPAGTPQPIIDILQDAVRRVVAEPDFQAFLSSVSVEPVPDSTPVSTAAYMWQELEKWRPIIQATGMTME